MIRCDKSLGLINYSLRNLYKMLGITEQAVSQHRKRMEGQGDRILLIHQLVLEYRRSHPGCGMAKIFDQLQIQGIGRDRFIAILKSLGFQLEKKNSYHKTTIVGYIRYPNLIEGMLVHGINQVWQTDITYFHTGKRHYYITFIIDVYSKLIICYEVSQTLHAAVNVKCLQKAIRIRKLSKSNMLIHHSDRGSQFTSFAYLGLLDRYNISTSMAATGQDNAYAERINGTIKNEYLSFRSITNFKELKLWTNQAVNHYNSLRIHKHLPKKTSPEIFEQKLLTLDYQKRPKVIIYAGGNSAIREDKVFLNCIPKKDLQAHICPVKISVIN